MNAEASLGLSMVVTCGYDIYQRSYYYPMRRFSRRTSLTDSPKMKSTFWSTIFFGATRKKYAAVMWNSEIARMIVKPEMSPMVNQSVHDVDCVVVRCSRTPFDCRNTCNSRYVDGLACSCYRR